jgi:Na+-transporting NADH:ubiquinone oxidoreductase subunit NqrF
MGMKHQDVKQHMYNEFRVEEEISQIQRIMSSLRREKLVIESGRGGHTQCNVCHSLLSTPTSTMKRTQLSFYYQCG